MTMTTTEEERRQRYLADLITTATPMQRLLMLFDSLLRDLAAAEHAFGGDDLKAVSDRLVHAQHIVFALRDPLDRTTELGASLAAVYGFCLDQLIQCNLRKDPELLGPVRDIVGRLAAADRQAAKAASAPVPVPVAAGLSADA